MAGRGMRRPMVARGLLLCGACVIGLAFAEAFAATWRAPIRSIPSVPSRDPELPTRFAETGNNSEVTLVVLGESSAAGVPFEHWMSVGKIVAWKLGEAIPGRRFSTLVLAEPGATLEGQYRKLADLRRRPDAVIVYCGHNEFFSRIASTRKVHQYRDDTPPLVERLDEFARHASPLFSLIEGAADKYRIEVVPSTIFKPPLIDCASLHASGIRRQFGRFPPPLGGDHRVYRASGVSPDPRRFPANDAGFEPLRSFLPPESLRAEREAFGRDFQACAPAGSF